MRAELSDRSLHAHHTGTFPGFLVLLIIAVIISQELGVDDNMD